MQLDLAVGDIKIPCFVLEDGTRVVSGRGMTTAIGMRGRGSGVDRVLTHRTLKKYFTPDVMAALERARFASSERRVAQTIQRPATNATILLRLSESILQARDAGALQTEQEKRYVVLCDALVRSFAKVGIIALVDEATGYQAVRARNELHKILEAYIAKELLPRTKRFPDEFYEQLFRLRGLEI